MSKATRLFNLMSKYVLFGFSHFKLGSCHSHMKDSHEVSNLTHFSKTEESSRPVSGGGTRLGCLTPSLAFLLGCLFPTS